MLTSRLADKTTPSLQHSIDAEILNSHFNVVAGRTGAVIRYFIRCCVFSSINYILIKYKVTSELTFRSFSSVEV